MHPIQPHTNTTGWPKAPPNSRYGSLAEEWISFDSPRLRRPRRAAAAAAATAKGEEEWAVGQRVEVVIDQREHDNRCVRAWHADARGACLSLGRIRDRIFPILA